MVDLSNSILPPERGFRESHSDEVETLRITDLKVLGEGPECSRKLFKKEESH